MVTMTAWRLAEDLANELRAALLEYTFERRALIDLLPQMSSSGDEVAVERTQGTCRALDALARHLLPALTCADPIDCCCLLAWHWNFERPTFAQRLEDGLIATALLEEADYQRRWNRLEAPVEAMLEAYPEMVRQALNNRAGAQWDRADRA